ncbi:hypothetical protein TNIN_135471 [Trichonephila inaurata madagascariensis]|uniref:Uncharacterized protein n=1 Tax=Trichonephila inaurata madagascariensis TaxID=2747483 RepID=A0A8X7BVF0_9ARAC|nr:hypothetical protein TNIN_135471 [Trichonephila inaurata madagascariensis]
MTPHFTLSLNLRVSRTPVPLRKSVQKLFQRCPAVVWGKGLRLIKKIRRNWLKQVRGLECSGNGCCNKEAGGDVLLQPKSSPINAFPW